MKKIAYLFSMLLLFIGSIASMSSCSKDESESPANPLVGTKWTVTYLKTKYIVEFTSATEVRSYEADINNNYTGYLHEGNYTYKNGQVDFATRKLYFMDAGFTYCYFYYFDKATISGTAMKLKTNVLYLKSSDMSSEEKGTEEFDLIRVQ